MLKRIRDIRNYLQVALYHSEVLTEDFPENDNAESVLKAVEKVVELLAEVENENI